ncbi:efflux RND transporter permease subunit, partial [Arthrospira platensis SPKY1]|nr:efflux RND transporter permease subunit [Arthrospira platensis SPKY1]
VTITVVTSTLAAISLTPMMASKMLRLREKQSKPKKISHQALIEPMLNRMDNAYGALLAWVLKHKLLTLTVSFSIFIGSLMLMRFVGTDFMPQTDESRITIAMELQTGTRV